jgi:hypothetical protein
MFPITYLSQAIRNYLDIQTPSLDYEYKPGSKRKTKKKTGTPTAMQQKGESPITFPTPRSGDFPRTPRIAPTLFAAKPTKENPETTNSLSISKMNSD